MCKANIRCSHRLWIDDLSQVTRGSRRQVRVNLVKCITDTAEGFHGQGLKIASKSVVVCSHYSDAVDVVKALRRKGIHMTAARSCVYLGADLGAGRRHAREQRVKRVVKHVARHKQVRRYTVAMRRVKISSRLEKQGGQAVGSYGYQLHG
eukprot:9029148-Pyramimonas_sp.AAC.1